VPHAPLTSYAGHAQSPRLTTSRLSNVIGHILGHDSLDSHSDYAQVPVRKQAKKLQFGHEHFCLFKERRDVGHTGRHGPLNRRGSWLLGLEFDSPSGIFWEIENPPADWWI
jgi:hypothetical protein